MSNAKDSYTYNRRNFEDAEFPILCETCLGDNPYIRMQKNKYGAECNVCTRPFTSFRWMPGRGSRYKKTEICQTCAKLKNVCQTCLLDLEYGLPVQVRDHALAIEDNLPKQGANRDFFIQNADRALAQTDGTVPGGPLANIAGASTNPLLTKLARTKPYYNRNRAHICSFFVKGECNRGEECPYRHEKPTDPDNPLSQQNMRDRYYGSNDPVAEKLLNRVKAMPKLTPPEDKTITTLYLGNLGINNQLVVTEADIRDYFYQFGEIRQIHMVPQKCICFIQFTTRQAAETAAESTFEQLHLKGQKIRVRWGQPQAQQTQRQTEQAKLDPVPNLPIDPCPVPNFFGLNSIPSSSLGKRAHPDVLQLPPEPPKKLVVPNVSYPNTSASNNQSSSSKANDIYYPSQDPQRLGAKGDVIE